MSGITEEEWQKMSPEERMEHQINNCIFCKIIKGEIPSKKVYEDSNFIGILDLNPGTKGHVLVLSKNHVQIMPQLGTELAGELGIVAKKISENLSKGLGVKGTSVFIANGAVAGQNAPHFMMHILPRKENDKVDLNPELKNVSVDKVKPLRDKMIAHLGLPMPEEEKPKNKEPEKQKEASSEKTGESQEEVKDEEQEKTTNKRSLEDELNNEIEVPTETTEEKTEESTEKSEPEPDKELLDKISNMFD